MMHAIRLGLISLMLVAAQPAIAGIYTYIDEQGNRVFTDQPNGRSVEPTTTKAPNSIPAPAARSSERPTKLKVLKAPTPGYTRIDIAEPAPDATIRDNAGMLSISVNSEPALHPGHEYRVLLDGEPAGPPSASTTLIVPHVDRGTHQLMVEIVNASGEGVQRSPPQVFHMLRTSLAQRRMVNPCKKEDYGSRPECPVKDKPAEKKNIPFVPFL